MIPANNLKVYVAVPDSIKIEPAEPGFINNTLIPAAEQLGLSTWDWIAFITALISLAVASVMAIYQWKTERNTMKITEEGQFGLLIDYFRHFYSNLVVTEAIFHKLNRRYKTHYPSEEHFRKLAVDLEPLHPEAFFHSQVKYKHIHKLLALVRNFNIEIGVAEQHLCSEKTLPEVKERDLNTLIFKQNLFCKKFYECICELCYSNYSIFDRILLKHKRIAKFMNCVFFRKNPRTPEYIAEKYRKKAEKTNKTEKRIAEYIGQARKHIIEEAISRDIYGEKELKSYKSNNECETDLKIAVLRERAKKIQEEYYEPVEKSFADLIFANDKRLFLDLLKCNIYNEIHGKNSQGYDKIFIIKFHPDDEQPQPTDKQ